jgi:alkanesulfonate monooxygenase SsuD/methylene tetrahydromethanopterin reductase-like flavin-dependent oxidoreductase (luciferase family)
MSKLEFHLFNYGAYPEVPHADALPESSLYVDLPNRYADPVKSHWYLDSYFDSLIFGEKLGFDGILTTTQMNGPVGLTPNSMLPAAYLAGQTDRIKIGAIGPILNTYTSPMRAAEEIALLDQITNGRLILGLPMGHGQNHHSAGVINPTYARERYWEAHDVIRKAFTEPGPFHWQGKHFHIPNANLWPKPLHFPDVWIPGAGSRLTLEKCAEFGYTWQALFSPRKALMKQVEVFRDAAEQNGYEAGPDQIAVVIFIHVAETDEQARLEAEPHLMFLMQNLNRAQLHDAFAPGLYSVDTVRRFMTGGGYRDRDISAMTMKDVLDEGWGIIGSPETVAAGLEQLVEDLGAGKLIHVADFGAMPNWMMRKSLTLMAEEVMPKFRDPGGKPIWAVEEPIVPLTHAEFAAQREETAPEVVPQARLHDGTGVVDVRTAHIEELRTQLRP